MKSYYKSTFRYITYLFFVICLSLGGVKGWGQCITISNGSIPNCYGGTISFFPALSGTCPVPNYQWNINSKPVSGATNSLFEPNFLKNNDTVTCTLLCTGGSCSNSISNKIVISGLDSSSTIKLISATGTDSQTVCQYKNIDTIKYAITGASGIKVKGLPNGISFDGTSTITGSSNVTGTFIYTISTTGNSCGDTSVSGVIIIKSIPDINLTSSIGTDKQEVCINKGIQPIVYSINGTSGATLSGNLPTGVTYNPSTYTFSGTPTVSGNYNYTITTFSNGICGGKSITGSIVVDPQPGITLTSVSSTTSQSLCAGSSITNIVYTLTNAGSYSITPSLYGTGLSVNQSGAVVTISGTPNQSVNYTITTINNSKCNDVSVSGLINVNEVVKPILLPDNLSTFSTTFNGTQFLRNFTNTPPGFITTTNGTIDSILVNKYKIEWGDGSQDTIFHFFSKKIKHLYKAGFYQLIILDTTTAGCISTNTYGIFVGNSPQGTLGNPGNLSGCGPLTKTFPISDTLGNIPGTIYNIYFGDGDSISYIHPNVPSSITHTYSISSCGSNLNTKDSNSFIATLEVTNPCKTGFSTVGPIQVSLPPIANYIVTPDTIVCINQSVTVKNTSNLGSSFSGNSCTNSHNQYWNILPLVGWTTIDYLGDNAGDPSFINWTNWNTGDDSLRIIFNSAGLFSVDFEIANGCGRSNKTMNICVNPQPIASFFTRKDTICAGDTLKMINTSTLALCGSNVYKWKVVDSNLVGCKVAALPTFMNGTSDTSVFPIYKFNSPGKYIISLVDSISGLKCTSLPYYDTIIVNDKPTVGAISISPNPVCQFDSISVHSTDSCNITASTKFNWSFAGGIPNKATTSIIPIKIQMDSVGADTVKIAVTNSCGTTTVTAIANVSAQPTVIVPHDTSLCNNNTIDTIRFNGVVAGATYNWSSSNASIGIAANGSGNIPAALLKDTSANPITDTIKVTPTKNGCTGITKSFKITVNPTPKLNSIKSFTFCNGSVFNYQATSTTIGTKFVWVRPAVTNGNGAGSSKDSTGKINDTLKNTGTSPVTITYYYTLYANGCSGIDTVIVVVNPTPHLTKKTDSICSGVLYNYTEANTGTGTTTYNWTRASILGVSNTTVSGATATINETLTDTTPSPVTVLYIFTLSANGCTNTDTLKVTVNPTPRLKDSVAKSTCNGTLFTYIPNSATTGVSYTWTLGALTGLTANPMNGKDSIKEVLGNTTANPIVAVYTILLTARGCTYNQLITDTVLPTPVLSSTQMPASICDSTSFTYNPTSNTNNVTFNWTRAVVAGILPATTNSGTGDINEVLHNTTNDSIKVVYMYAMPTSRCTNSQTVSVWVYPKPTVNVHNDTAICNGAPSGLIKFSGKVVYANYSWTNNNAAIGFGATGIDSIATFNGTNAGTAPVTAMVIVTPVFKYCSGIPDSFKITVNPTPVINSVKSFTVCNGSIFTDTVKSTTTGVKYSWIRAAVIGGDGLGSSKDSTGIIKDTLTNSTTSPITVTYVFTLVANGCSNKDSIKVVVNPTPKLSGTHTPSAICDSTLFSYTDTSATTGTTFSWSRAAVTGISNIGSSGTGASISEVLIDTTANPVTVKYVITMTANSCSNKDSIAVVVNPKPVLNSGLIAKSICNNNYVNYTPGSATGGTTYSWTRPGMTGITPITGGGTGAINEVLVNNSSNPIVVSYNFIVTANGCTNNQTVTDTVFPAPSLNSSLTPGYICDSTIFNYHPTSATSGTVFNWTRAVVAGIMPSTAGSGKDSINEVLHNTTNDSIKVIYAFALPANGCTNIQNVSVLVYPKPTVNAHKDTAICNGASSGTIIFAGAVAYAGYSWTNNNTAIGLAANGKDSIATFNGINTGVAPVTAMAIVKPSFKTCNGIADSFNITVNPTPVISSLKNFTVCNGSVFTDTVKSAAAGVKYSWVRGAVSGGNGTKNSKDSLGIINDTLINNTTAPITVTYVFTLVANGCIGMDTVKVTVNPTPLLISKKTDSICSGINYTYTSSSSVGSATITWKRQSTAGINNTTGNTGTGSISETLTNSTPYPTTVTYVFTLSANGCNNTDSLKVKVNPTPILNSVLIAKSICNNNYVSYVPTSLTFGTTYSWTRGSVLGITPNTSNGTDSIHEALIDTSALYKVVSYVITLRANGCINQQTVTDTVFPAPILSSSLTPPAICSGATFNYIPTSNTPSVIFNWTRAAVSGIIAPTATSGTGTINDQLINQTNTALTVVYSFALPANSCTNVQSVSVVVNPTDTAIVNRDTVFCNGTVVNGFISNGTVVGGTYSWTNTNSSIGVALTGSGNVPSFTINDTSANPLSSMVTITPTYSGCPGVGKSFKITVNPTPKLSSVKTGVLCNDSIFNYVATSATNGVKYSWARAAVIGGNGAKNSKDSLGVIKDTLINTGTAPITVTYVFTLVANGCSNTDSIKVVINPTPKLSGTHILAAICDSTLFSYTDTSATTGTTFSWSRAAVTGISNIGSSGTGASISEVLIDTTANPVTVKYFITMTANSCSNKDSIAVVVNPKPILNTVLIAKSICNNNYVIYTPGSATGGTSFSWVRNAVDSIKPISNGGVGGINEALINDSTGPVVVSYIYTLTANGCSNVQTVTDTVFPAPILSSTLTPAAICSGSVFNYVPKSATNNVVFNWTRAAVAGIQAPTTTSGVGTINDLLINLTNKPITVVYSFALPANNCTNVQSVSVVVNPTDTAIVNRDTVFCNGTIVNGFISNGTVAGGTYSWTNTNSSIGVTLTGSGNVPSFTINDTSANPLSSMVTITPTYSGCPGVGKSFKITVNPTPKLSTPLSSASICNKTVFTYQANSLTNKTKYSWTRAAVGINVASSSTDSSGLIKDSLFNNGNVPITVNYIITLYANGCSNTQTVSVVVNPTPQLTSSKNDIVCSGIPYVYTATGSVVNTQFSWTRALVAGISNSALGGSSNDINELLVNTTSNSIVVTYIISMFTDSSCSNKDSIKVTVNPNPVLTSTLTPTGICNNNTFSYIPQSATTGTVFTWVRNAVAGITPNSNSGADSIHETLVNNTTNPLGVNYEFTLSVNGCTNKQIVTDTVYPTPILSSTLTPPAICSGTTFDYIPTSATNNVTFNWTRAAVAGIQAPPATSGVGTIKDLLINLTNKPITVVYSFALPANNCTNVQRVSVVVNPTDTAIVNRDTVFCNGTIVNGFISNGTVAGGTYSWTNTNSSIGIALTGNGNVPSFTISDTSANPLSSMVTITPTYSGCVGVGKSFMITVNPTPKLSTPLSPASICNKTVFNYQAKSLTNKTEYSWTRAAVGINVASSSTDSSGLIKDSLFNNGNVPITVNYIITLYANGCSNTQIVSVVVNPTPQLTSSKNDIVCSGIPYNYTSTGSVANTQFSWTRAVVAGISNSALGGSSNGINELLVNTTSNPIVVTYIISMSTDSSCSNKDSIKVIVNPKPVLISTLTPTGICNNNTFSYIPQSATTGTVFTWVRNAVAGITPNSNSGADSIHETLVNNTTNPLGVNYEFTLSVNGCTNKQIVTDTVYPTPILSSTLTPPAICSGTTFDYIPTSATNNVTFNWTRAAVAGIQAPPASSGSGPINDVLINQTNKQITVVYAFAMPANNCTNTQNVSVVVNPTDTAIICNDTIFCNGTIVNGFISNGTVVGGIYSWTNTNSSIGVALTGSGNVPSFTISDTSANPLSSIVTVTPTFSGCVGVGKSFKITVNPTPKLSTPLSSASICNKTVFNYQANSLTNKTKYSWTRAAVGINLASSSTDSSGLIKDSLFNNSNVPITVNYIITLYANGCSNTQTISVVLNPTPQLTSSKFDTVCSGISYIYTVTGSVVNTHFSWSRPAVPGISNAAVSNSAAGINELLVNTTPNAIVVMYIISMTTDSSCTNKDSVKVIVNPNPVLTSTLTPTSICNNNTFDYTPLSATTGTVFTWVRNAVAGITPNINNGTGAISETLINTTTDPVVVYYEYTLSVNGCINKQTVKDTVYPTPILSSTLTPPSICDSTKFSYTPTSATNNVTFNWTRAIVPGIIPATADSGTYIINETLYNTTNDSIKVVYAYSMPANGCNNNQNVTVIVYPMPKVVVPHDTAMCNGSFIDSLKFTGWVNATTYNWINYNTNIGLNTTGWGTINPFNVANNGASTISSIIKVVPWANNCIGIPDSFKITVYPTPQISSSKTSSVCNRGVFNYSVKSLTDSVKYSWVRVAINNNPATNSKDSSGVINDSLFNSTPYPITVTYIYTLVAKGCSHQDSIHVIVYPTPQLNSSKAVTKICNNTTLNYSATSLTSGTTFSWNRAFVTGISNAAGSANSAVISELLTNTTPNPITVTYVIQLTANGCFNTDSIKVVVKPTPVLNSSLIAKSICNNETVSYVPTSATIGTTYSWTRTATTNITPSTNAGEDSIHEVLVNTGVLPVVVSYVITLTADSCNNIQTITDTVFPTPTLSSTLTPPSICSGVNFGYFPTSNTPGVVFNWTRANVNGIIAPAISSGVGPINDVLVNTTNDSIKVVYSFYMPANGCNNSQDVSIWVYPVPKVVVPKDSTLCNGFLRDSSTFSGWVNGTTYNWTNNNTTIGLGASGWGTILPFIVTNSGTVTINANIVVTPWANGCKGISDNFNIIVYPTPKLNSIKTGIICNNLNYNYQATSLTANTNFAWIRYADLFGNMNRNSADSSGVINEILKDTTTVPVITTYYYTMVANGCVNNDSIKVTVNPDARAIINDKSDTLCAPGTFDAQNIVATSYPLTNSGYQWFDNNNNIGQLITFPGYTINNPGDSINVKLVTTSLYGCKSDSTSKKFYTFAKPVVSFIESTKKGCGPLKVDFINTTTPPDVPTKYIWDFGNGIKDTTAFSSSPVTVIFVADTSNKHRDSTYFIKLTAITPCDTLQFIDSVLVKPMPKALFQPNKTVGCSPFNFIAINNSLGGPSSYNWSFGDGAVDTFFNDTARHAVNHVYHTGFTDTFTVKLEAVNACGIDSFKVNLVVYPNTVFPDLIVNGQNTYACAPQNIQFVNNSYGGNWYSINFGDNSPLYVSIKSNDTVYHYYTVAGIYPVTLHGTNGCSDTTSIQNILIYPKPHALFSIAKTQYCEKETISFINKSDTGLQYYWKFGDGFSSTNINPVHAYTTAGNYTITLLVSSLQATGSVCTDTFKLPVTINPITPAVIKSNINAINCDPYTFISNLPSGLYSSADWVFSNPYSNDTLRSGNQVTYTYTIPDNYPITLMVINQFGCKDTVHTMITVTPTPKAISTITDTVYCGPTQNLTLLNASTYTGSDFVGYSWYVNGVMASNNSQQLGYTFNAPVNFSAPDTFKVLLTATNSYGCSSSFMKIITLMPKPNVRFNVLNDSACAPATTVFIDQTLYADNYSWYLDGVLFSSIRNPVQIILPTQNTNYTITLIASSALGCGTDTFSKTVVTYENPIAKIGLSDSTSCNGQLNVIFNDQSITYGGTTVGTYFWTFGDGSISNSNPIQHSYTLPGDYTVTLTVYDSRGCKSDVGSRRIAIFGSPTASFTTNNTCEGISSLFTSYSKVGIGSTKFLYQAWDFGDGSKDTGATITHIYIIPGVYTVKLTVLCDSSCIPVSTVQSIVVYGKPQADFSSVNNCAGLPVIFNNHSKPGFAEQYYQTLYWYFGDGSNLSQTNVQHVYTDSGNYNVMLIVTGYQCGQLKDTITKPIHIVEPRSGISYPIIYASYYTPTLLTAENGGVSYNWSPTIGLISPSSDTTTAIYNPNDQNKIQYIITITDSSGCVIEDKQDVWVFVKPDILVPTGFTPNGDGVNDILIPNYINIKKLNSWRIYDRWGNLIFETSNLHQGWDGRINGVNAPMETYTWVVEGVSDTNEIIVRKGMSTLIRD